MPKNWTLPLLKTEGELIQRCEAIVNKIGTLQGLGIEETCESISNSH